MQTIQWVMTMFRFEKCKRIMNTELPTKPGNYYWRESDVDEWEHIFVMDPGNGHLYGHSLRPDGIVATSLHDWDKDYGAVGEWLPIPTADELVELQACKKMVDGLLRLVDDVYEWRQHIPGPEFCELRAEIQALGDYATIIRKEKR